MVIAQERGVQIPLATVEPWDLVAVNLTDWFTLEFRVKGEPYLRDGDWRVDAYATEASMASITSLDGMVTLLQRRKPGEDAEKTKHPHGWGFWRAGDPQMHYFVDTVSLCDGVRGYAGLCYPTWEPSLYNEDTFRCAECLLKLDS